MRIMVWTIVLGLACPAAAFDMQGALDKVKGTAADPKAAVQEAKEGATDLAMAKLTKELKNVQNEKGPIVFKTGKADIDVKKCENTLKSIDGIVKKYPGFLVQIEGHTDNVGKAKKNLELSQKRAEAVMNWLTANMQTPVERLRAKGFGDTQPIESNKTSKGRAKNRRVDFSVTKQ